MDFFSKFKKTDEANPASDDREPELSSYGTTDNYSSGDTTKGADVASDEYGNPGSYTTEDYVDKPSGGGGDAAGTYASEKYDQSGGGYGEETEDGYSKKPSYGGATAGTDDYEQPQGGYGEDTEEGFSEKPSINYGGATTETDEYQKPEGEYGEDTGESFYKEPSYGGSYTAGTDEYEKPEAEGEYGEDATKEKPSGTETDDYGKYTSTEDFSYTPSGEDATTGADTGEGYGADATESYLKKPSGGYGATTGNYASDDKYNE